MARAGAVLAQCALRVALRRRYAARPALPARVHRGARLLRSAADTASFSFSFHDDEPAPVMDASFGDLSRAVEAGNLDVALALLVASPVPASRRAAATDSCTRLIAELCKRGRPRDAERAFNAAISHGTAPRAAAPPRG